MRYVLFIDDERDYSFVEGSLIQTIIRHKPQQFLIARNSKQAIKLIKANGLPCFIFFDHDLGEINNKVDTSMNVVNFITENYLSFPDYIIHSQNPIGAKNLHSKIESFKRFLESQSDDSRQSQTSLSV
jgi:hypothetical protein